jgi:hypothetical protein
MLQPYYSASSCHCLAFVYLLAEDKNKGIGLWHSDSLHDPHADNKNQCLLAGSSVPGQQTVNNVPIVVRIQWIPPDYVR